MNITNLLFGPLWTVSFRYEPDIEVSRVVRARSEFNAKWKVATKLLDNAFVGYLAFKWMNGLYLAENEVVQATQLKITL